MSVAKSTLTSAATIQWQSGDTFNGWLLLIAVPPNFSGVQYPNIALRNSSPKLIVPQRVKVAIQDGVLDSSSKVWQTSSLVPTRILYSSWFYDDTNQLIATGTALFSITTDPFTISIPALVDPTAAIVSPTPESVPNTTVQTITYSAPTQENVAGNKNGVNTAFTISRAGTIVFIIRNGNVLTPTVDYTQSGTAITFLTGSIPAASDQLIAVIF
jgi:hypothetical protein